MTSTDTTASATTVSTVLSADWQKVVAFFTGAEQDIGTFLAKVAAGAEVFIEDIESVAQWVAAHISTINSTIAAGQVAAAVVAPNNASVAKIFSDLQTSANDVAQFSNALSTGSTAGAPAVVTTAVSAINAVNQLSSLANTASQTLAILTANSPTATTTVSVSSPAAL